MTEDEKHDFIADVTGHLLDEINKGTDIFVVLSFKHSEERDTMRVTSAVIKTNKTLRDERMRDAASDLLTQVMDKLAPRWRDN